VVSTVSSDPKVPTLIDVALRVADFARRQVVALEVQPVLLRVAWYCRQSNEPQAVGTTYEDENAACYLPRGKSRLVLLTCPRDDIGGPWTIVVTVVGPADGYLTTADPSAKGHRGPTRKIVAVTTALEVTIHRGEYGFVKKEEKT
jgi:hypothetical protein